MNKAEILGKKYLDNVIRSFSNDTCAFWLWFHNNDSYFVLNNIASWLIHIESIPFGYERIADTIYSYLKKIKPKVIKRVKIKTFHMGFIIKKDKIIVQMRRDKNRLSCDLWEYWGERITTKKMINEHKHGLLKAINKKFGKNYKSIVID